MKIYVATKYEEAPRARQVMGLLIAHGHTITYNWTWNEQSSSEQAHKDMQGVLDADALVLIIEKDLQYKGALVEVGIALGKGIPVYVIGSYFDNCIFSALPQVHQGIDSLVQVRDLAYTD